MKIRKPAPVIEPHDADGPLRPRVSEDVLATEGVPAPPPRRRQRAPETPSYDLSDLGGEEYDLSDLGGEAVEEPQARPPAPAPAPRPAPPVQPSGVMETIAQWGHDAVGDFSLPGLFGLEEPDAASVRSAMRPAAQGEQIDDSDRWSAMIPTAPRPEGMSATAADRRTQAGGLAMGSANPLGGAFLDELSGVAAMDGLTPEQRTAVGPSLTQRIRGALAPDVAHASQSRPGADVLAASPPRPQSAHDQYVSGRDQARSMTVEASEQAPGASLLGSAVPNLALGLMGPVGPTGPGWANAASRMTASAGLGAGLGALRGAGEAEQIEDVPLEMLHQGVSDGATAGLMSGAFDSLAQGARGMGTTVLPWLDDLTRQSAAGQRMRASGLQAGSAPSTAYGQQVRRMGGDRGVAAVLDANQVGGRYVPTPGRSVDQVEQILADAGEQLDAIHREMRAAGGPPEPVDALATRAVRRGARATPPSGGQVDARALVDRLESIAQELEQSRTGPHRRAGQQIRDDLIAPLLEQLAPDGTGPRNAAPLTFEQAHQLRQQYDELARYGSAATPTDRSVEAAARQARGELSDLMNQSLDAVDPALRERWQAANQRWQLGALLRDRARAQGSQLPAAIAQGIGGGPVGMAAQSLASAGFPGVTARGLTGIANALRAGGPRMAAFADVLERAAQQGPQVAAATHYVLSQQNPEYRAAVERAQEQ